MSSIRDILKKIFIIITLITMMFSDVISQTFKLFDTKVTSDKVSTKFIILDPSGTQDINIDELDFVVTEDGSEKQVTLAYCPQTAIKKISSVLTIDISGSMRWDNNLSMAKAAAKTWIDGLPNNGSECAITSYNKLNFENHDWSTDKNSLHRAVDRMKSGGGTDYDEGLLGYPAGGIKKAKSGKHGKKVVVFLTDGLGDGTESSIIDTAKNNNIVVYCVTVRMPAPDILKNITRQTGGAYFENVSSTAQLLDIYKSILAAETKEPCILEWLSDGCSGNKEAVVELLKYSLSETLNYESTGSNSAYLEFNPKILNFGQVQLGESKVDTVMLTARGGEVEITGTEIDNTEFTLIKIEGKTTPFTLTENDYIIIIIEFTPQTSVFQTGRLKITSNACMGDTLLMNGSVNNELVVIQPNGGELLEQCKDTLIRWGNVLPNDTVVIDFSTNNGQNWDTITTEGVGLSHLWQIPDDVESTECLMRVTLKYQQDPCICVGSEVKIGDQKWMVCNLDVTHFRNGDSIPHVQDSTEWANADYGAWCYYDNDSTNGQCYGKLYNWYAVNDPRGLAPYGWHIPTDDEWKVLEMSLGMSQKSADSSDNWRGNDEGSKLKEIGTSNWSSDTANATNESGFRALPGGTRDQNGIFNIPIGFASMFWTSTDNVNSSFARYLAHYEPRILRREYNKKEGFSVRCLKNNYTELCKVTWTAQNLDVDKYRDGTSIRHAATPEDWQDANSKQEGAWCYYNNNDSLGIIYGKLYNWYAVNDPRGLTPHGWHIPTDEEWTELEICLGGSNVAGAKLKETGIRYWEVINTGATNESEFSALPGGWRTQFGQFSYKGEYGIWWSATERDGTYAWNRRIHRGKIDIEKIAYDKGLGMAVRIVRGDTVNICNQTWMVPNLNVDHYRNGDSIPEVTDPTEWANADYGAWCYYNNDRTNDPDYGKLYNWYAVNDPRGLAPEGWYTPYDEDWKELEMCLGMSQADADQFGSGRGSNEGGKLKATGTIENSDGLWSSPNSAATNEVGFTALPAGQRSKNGETYHKGGNGYWWCASEVFLDSTFAYQRYLQSTTSDIIRNYYDKKTGFSIRCIKGNEVQICDQRWSNKNLDVETYRNGDPIPHVTDSSDWINLTTGAWCYSNNNADTGKVYGKLYNWYAVNDPRGLAPKGWHIPSDDEWKELETCLGMPLIELDETGWRGASDSVGSKLKEIGTKHWWNGSNADATNESGFFGLPGGYRSGNYYVTDFDFHPVGEHGFWWSSTETSDSTALYRTAASYFQLFSRNGDTSQNHYSNYKHGFSVRLVKGDYFQICDQIWTTKNLDIEYYRNGDSITYCANSIDWQDANSKGEGAWCYYNNDPGNDDEYGKLYNWYAVNDSRGLAPEGWHVATDEEWKELEMCLGMSQDTADLEGFRGVGIGNKLKEIGTDNWDSPGGTNEALFWCLPGGYRKYDDSEFIYLGHSTRFWTSDEYNSSNGTRRLLMHDRNNIERGPGNKGNGYSIRLVKDQ